MNWMMVLILFMVLAIFLCAGLQLFEPRYVLVAMLIFFPAAVSLTLSFQISRFGKVARFVSDLKTIS
jgi:hypothetical protein